jgi:hypothetical protein
VPLLATALALSACAAVGRAPTPAPPASELRGYRAKTPHGVDLLFDTKLQVFSVPDSPGTYWLDGRYYRREGSGVECARKLDGPWAACPADSLPPALR